MARQPIDKTYSVSVAIDAKTELIAGHYGLDSARVRRILARTVRDGRGKPVRAEDEIGARRGLSLRPNLHRALGATSDHEAVLHAFETSNLGELSKRESAVEYLTFGAGTPFVFTPFYSLQELHRLTASFIREQEENREPLVMTGFPKYRKRDFPWLDWHLWRLYFTKYPVEFERTTLEVPSIEEVRSLHWRERGTLHQELVWSSKIAGSPKLDTHVIRGPLDLFGIPWYAPKEVYPTRPAPPTSLLDDPEPHRWIRAAEALSRKLGIGCSYDDAAILPPLRTANARRLEALRERVFGLRVRVLRNLLDYVERRTTVGLRESALQLFRESLDRADVEFLVGMDRRYLGFDGRSGIHVGRDPQFVPGGLTNLLEVVGHFEKEIAVGTLHRTRLEFETLDLDKPLTCYYQVLGRPPQSDVDQMIHSFLDRDREECFVSA
ncbi:MAG: hypothetical protein ACKVU1_00690 [bacterium]